jgi:hypothetical protein
MKGGRKTHVGQGVDSLAAGRGRRAENTEKVVGRRRGLGEAGVARRKLTLASDAGSDTVGERADSADGTAESREGSQRE